MFDTSDSSEQAHQETCIDSERDFKTVKKTKKPVPTAKKLKIEGKRTYVDRETGELVDCRVVRIADADANFEKLWLGHILEAIDEIGNAKMKVLMFLLSNRDKHNNSVITTNRKLAEATGISLDTVSRTLVALKKNKIITRTTGVIFLNPDVVFKGGRQKRMNVMIRYQHLESLDAE
jgi:DNA-binding transcriptional ArsR family regulator